MEGESIIEKIQNLLRLSKELRKVNELPVWMNGIVF